MGKERGSPLRLASFKILEARLREAIRCPCSRLQCEVWVCVCSAGRPSRSGHWVSYGKLAKALWDFMVGYRDEVTLHAPGHKPISRLEAPVLPLRNQ